MEFLSYLPPLQRLEYAELIRQLHELDPAYLFKHNLVQETAYQSLLKNDRKHLHRACADSLERIYPDRLDEYAPVLVRHFMEAGDEPKTFEYARRAGDAALRVQAFAEALMQYDTAVLLAPRLDLEPADVIHVYRQRGRTLELMWQYDDAEKTYQSLVAFAQERADPRLELGALGMLGTLYTFPNPKLDLHQSLRLNERAIALADELGDGAAQVHALWNLMLHDYFDGNSTGSYAHGQQALALADQYGLREMRAYILNDQSRSAMSVASVSVSLDLLAQAREIWIELQNLPMLADNLASAAEASVLGGLVTQAQQFAHAAIDLCLTIGNVWNHAYSTLTFLQLAYVAGDGTRFLELATLSDRLGRESGFEFAEVMPRVVGAIMLGSLGAPAVGLSLLDQLPQVTHGDFGFLEAWFNSAKAHLYFLQKDWDKARAAVAIARERLDNDDLSNLGPTVVAIVESELALTEQRYSDAYAITHAILERMREAEMVMYASDLWYRMGKAAAGMERWAEAEECFEKGRIAAEEMYARPILWQILVALAELQDRLGNPADAAGFRAQAHSIVAWLADATPTDPATTILGIPLGQDLRAAFCALPAVCELLASAIPC